MISFAELFAHDGLAAQLSAPLAEQDYPQAPDYRSPTNSHSHSPSYASVNEGMSGESSQQTPVHNNANQHFFTEHTTQYLPLAHSQHPHVNPHLLQQLDAFSGSNEFLYIDFQLPHMGPGSSYAVSQLGIDTALSSLDSLHYLPQGQLFPPLPSQTNYMEMQPLVNAMFDQNLWEQQSSLSSEECLAFSSPSKGLGLSFPYEVPTDPTMIARVQPNEATQGLPQASPSPSLPSADLPAPTTKARKSNSHYCPFPSCPKTFTRPANCAAHFRSHTGDQPFECSHPGCGQKYARKFDRKRHEKTHSGIKAYACPKCQRGFARSDYRLKHLAKMCKDTN